MECGFKEASNQGGEERGGGKVAGEEAQAAEAEQPAAAAVSIQLRTL